MSDRLKQVILAAIAGVGVTIERIVLFGSQARGDARADSDLDILVITRKPLANADRMRLTKAVRSALAKLLIPADVIVLSHEEVEARRLVPGSIIRNALREGGRGMTMSDAAQWIAKAEEDLRLVAHELVLPDEEIVTSGVCFHAQQAAEKYLKAFLSAKGVDFGKWHVLELLQEQCVQVDAEFATLDVGNLTDYAVQLRYPDYCYTPDVEEARQANALAVAIKDFVLKKLGKNRSG